MRALLLLSVCALLVSAAGCRKVYPGDGQVVIVDLVQDGDMPVENGTVVRRLDVVRFGTHVWDSAGARFRLPDEVGPAEDVYEKHLPLRIGGCSAGEGIAGYDLFYGDICLEGKDPALDIPGWGWGQVVAHEIGHAMGLDHINDHDAIMTSYGPLITTEINDADLAEYRRVWR